MTLQFGGYTVTLKVVESQKYTTYKLNAFEIMGNLLEGQQDHALDLLLINDNSN